MGSVRVLNPAEIRRFLEASDGIDFNGTERSGVYRWVEEPCSAITIPGCQRKHEGCCGSFS